MTGHTHPDGPRCLVLAPQPFFTPRGTPFSVYYRTLVVAAEGVRIDLLTYGEGADPDIPGVRVVRIPHPRFLRPVPIGPSGKKAVLDLVMILWTIGMMLRRRYAFVHAHEEAVFWARPLAAILRTRLVYDMHSSLPQQLRNFDFTQSRLLIGLFDRLERWSLRGSAAVITICPDLAEQALASGVPESRHFLIENSIFDPVRLRGEGEEGGERPGAAAPGGEAASASASVSASASTLSPGARTIVYAGTLESYQGIDLLLDAFAGIAAAHPDTILLIAGGADEQIHAAERRARELGLGEDRTRFLGRLSKQSAMDLIRAATVVVSPRISGTNTPLKIYELLASGVPMVATRIFSHTQVLTDDVCVLAEPDWSAFGAGIARLLDDPAERTRIATAAAALYEERYSRPRYVAKIRALLELVVPGNGRAAPAVAGGD